MNYPFRASFRVDFRDVDLHGILHHSNYLHYFERARVEMLRSLGLTYNEIVKRGVGMFLTEAGLKFIAPVRFDDIVDIDMAFSKVGRSSFKIEYLAKVNEKDVATGFTKLVCVDTVTNKPIEIPTDIKSKFTEHLSEED